MAKTIVGYSVVRTGGTIGSKSVPTNFATKEEATRYTKFMRKNLTPWEKSYYKIGYKVVPIYS